MKRTCLVVLCIALFGLVGCSKVTPISKEITMELGQGLSEDPAQFVNVADEAMYTDMSMDFSEVDFKKAGDYMANAVYQEKKYPITIHIVDTTAPDAELKAAYTVLQPDVDVKAENLFSKIEDKAETVAVFLSTEKTGELEETTAEELDALELPTATTEVITEGDFSETVQFPEEGVYTVKLAVKDASGNAVVYELPVYVDGTAPELEEKADEEITFSKPTDYYMVSEEIVFCMDNFDGELTGTEFVTITKESEELTAIDNIPTYIYTIKAVATDRAGNATKETWKVTITDKYTLQTLAKNVVGKQDVKNNINSNSNNLSDGFHNDLARQLFDLTNQSRADNGLTLLVWDSTLENTANTRAKEIVSVYSHTRPDGSTWNTIADIHILNGENIVRYGITPTQCHNAFMNSPSHKENIMDTDFTRIGIGYYIENGKSYVVEHFGM